MVATADEGGAVDIACVGVTKTFKDFWMRRKEGARQRLVPRGDMLRRIHGGREQ